MPERPARTWSDSIRVALDADETSTAVRSAAECWPLYFVSDPGLVRAAIQSLPPERWQADPWLLVGLAASVQNSADAVERAASDLYLKEARRLLRSRDDLATTVRIPTALAIATHQRTRGRFARAEEGLEQLRRELEHAEDVTFEWRVQMQARLGIEHALIRLHRAQFDTGESPLGPALALAENGLLPHERMLAYGIAALSAQFGENYGRVEEWSDRAAEAALAATTDGDAAEIPLIDSPAMAPAVFAMALAAGERAEVDRARALLDRLDSIARGGEWRAYAAVFAGSVALLEKDYAGALEPLRRARQLTRHWSDDQLVDGISLAVRSRAETMLGNGHELDDDASDEVTNPDARHLFCPGLGRGWRALRDGRPADALTAVSPCIRLGERHARGSLVDALLIDASARLALGDEVAGAASFEYALQLSAQSGFRRAFLHVPAHTLATLLDTAATRAQQPASVRLAAELRDSILDDPSALPRLSDREREILAGLAAGRSLRELSQQLYISLNTMKTHVRHIYRKLGVGSRTDAVAAAQQLGIPLVVTRQSSEA